MTSFWNSVVSPIIHLLFPQTCIGCGDDLIKSGEQVCGLCRVSLDETGFQSIAGNPAERIFWGRLPVDAAASLFYFQQHSLIQQLMHRFKYQSDRNVCFQLGKMMGRMLKESGRFNVDALVPVPLFAERERKRGYNQSEILSRGMSDELNVPVLKDVVFRLSSTNSQTDKSRTERLQNMQGRFVLEEPKRIEGKHLLIVDDVLTTGATLEACALALLKSKQVCISLATLCYAADV